MCHAFTRKARVLELRQVVLSHLPYLPHNNAFQRDGLAAAILRTRRMFTTVLIYHVVFCKAAAECYPLGGRSSYMPRLHNLLCHMIAFWNSCLLGDVYRANALRCVESF